MSIHLRDYANPVTHALDLPGQIQQLSLALSAKRKGWVALDFSGVAGVSQTFGEALFQLLECDFPETWLVPRCYDTPCRDLVNRLLSRLRRQRDEAWRAGCERLNWRNGPASRD